MKEPPLASNFNKLKEFCDKIIPANTYFSIPCISQEKAVLSPYMTSAVGGMFNSNINTQMSSLSFIARQEYLI